MKKKRLEGVILAFAVAVVHGICAGECGSC